MSYLSAIILGMNEKWIKYSYVCPSCDSLLEYTIKDTYTGVSKVTCICGGNAVQVSVEDATIQPSTNERNQMETVEYLKAQIAELEDIKKRQNEALTTHQNCDYWKSENGRIQSQIIKLINDAYTDDIDATDIVETLCQIIDYEPKKEIEFTATMTFTGRIDVPLIDLNDFDLTSILSDAYVDINNGDVIIDSYDLYDAEEC